jgi:uncharacterized protein
MGLMRGFAILRLALGFVIAACALAVAGEVSAADRVALVIGNGAYQNVPQLDNPVNDAEDIAKSLAAAGFDVIEKDNATRGQMADAVRDFTDRIKGAEVALFYYAGHGMQMEGENYLVPVDARLEKPADVRFATINLTDIQQEMQASGRANIIVLDACRNNPFAARLASGGRAVGERGLGRVEASGVGTLIVFSTQPNNVALDGGGRNSPFAAALAKNIGTPNIEIRQMISRVRADVLAATDQKQVPWDSSSLVGDVYLTRTAEGSVAQSLQPTSTPDAGSAGGAPRQQEPVASGAAAECEKLASPMPMFATLDQIRAARHARDWARALAVCKSASEADPNSVALRYRLGQSYFQTKDYLNAQKQLSVAADAGDADAEQMLGFMFANGAGVVKDYYRAFDYFSRGAAAGNPRAVTNLGSMYSNGWGVAEDDSRALALYEKGIELGNPFALAQAGVMYFNGKGAPRDYAAAEQYFLQAANLGDGYSMKFLAVLYEHGLVGPADATRAAQLRLRAAEEDPDSVTPQVTFPKVSATLSQRVHTNRRIVYYRYGGGSYNPAWQAAPGDNRCCPKNMLVCPLGRTWCG